MTWNEQDAKKVEELYLKTSAARATSKLVCTNGNATNALVSQLMSPSLKLDKLNSGTLTKADIDAVVSLKTDVSKAISIETAPAYVAAVRSGGNSDAAVAAAKDGPGVLAGIQSH